MAGGILAWPRVVAGVGGVRVTLARATAARTPVPPVTIQSRNQSESLREEVLEHEQHLADYGPDAGSTVAQAPKPGLDLPDNARCDPGELGLQPHLKHGRRSSRRSPIWSRTSAVRSELRVVFRSDVLGRC